MKNLINGFLKILGLLIQNLKWIILFGVLIAGSVLSTKCANDKSWNDKYKAFRDSAQAVATHFSDSMNAEIAKKRHESDSLKLVVNRQLRMINALQDTIETIHGNNVELGRVLDSLIRELGPTAPRVCALCLVLRDSLQKEVTVLRRQTANWASTSATQGKRISTLESALNTSTFQSDSLRRVILNMPAPRPDRRLFGFISLTPTQSFFTGAILGTIGTLTLGKSQ